MVPTRSSVAAPMPADSPARGQLGADPVGVDGDLRRRGLGAQDPELVPAEPRHHVGLPGRPAHDPGGPAEHGVTGGVTVPVVDLLEAVEVDHHDARVVAQAVVARLLGLAGTLPRAPVAQPGERVGLRLQEGQLDATGQGHGAAVEVADHAEQVAEQLQLRAELGEGVGAGLGVDAADGAEERLVLVVDRDADVAA